MKSPTDHLSIESLDPSWGIAAVVDVETTGLNPAKHEILELALVLFAFRRDSGQVMGIIDEYIGFQEPKGRISAKVTGIHGINRQMVKGKCLDSERICSMLERAEFLIAHNAEFDKSFLVPLFPICKKKPWLCTMDGLPWKSRGYESKGLQNLLSEHRITTDVAHRAEADAKGVLMLLSKWSPEGGTYLSELIDRRERRRRKKRAAATEWTPKTDVSNQEPSSRRGGCLPIIILFILLFLLARGCR